MRNILAIARLTFREGIRMRIVLIFLIVLVFVVLRLPFALQGDETLAGRLQTFLSYSLGAVSVLLGLSSVFLSCSTLTSDIKNSSIHLVVTKPVARFQILLGKWLGINLLMFLLLAGCGLTIYAFARFIKTRPVAFKRDEINIRDVVWRARVARKPTPPDLSEAASQWVASQVKQGQTFSRGTEFAVAERVRELLNAWRTLPPDRGRVYLFEDLIPPRDPETALQVRYRVRAMPLPADEMVPIDFAFVDPDSGQPLSGWHNTRERSRDLHQFLAIGQGFIRDGRAAILAVNPLPATQRNRIHFIEDDWLEILYNVGTFEENYVKTLAIIMARLAFLSALGLLFSTFVSFPVACLAVFTFYVICFGMPFILESIGADLEYRTDDIDPYGRFGPFIRPVLLVVLKVLLPNFSHYDGAQYLIDGEYISWGLVVKSLLHTVVYGALLLLGVGWLVFRSREIAEVTV